MKHLVLLGMLVTIGVYSAKLPEYIKKCKKSGDNSECVVENLKSTIEALVKNNGDPKFKLQGLKPVSVEKIELQATPQLKVILSKVDFFGFDTITEASGNLSDDILHIAAHLPRVEILGNYEINGRILVLPIQGQGTCNITLTDLDVEYTGQMTIEERKGKKYYQLGSDNTSLKIKNIKNVYWEFNNLFNGDERLGQEMNRFLNENSLVVFKEVQASMEDTAAYSILNQFANGYLHYIPVEELFDE